MERRRVDSTREKRILIAMITSTPFLSQAVRYFDLELIETPHYKQVAEWCIEYHETYREAPREHIEDLYHAWSEDNPNKNLVQATHDFLDGLGKEYDRDKVLNVPFLLDELKEVLELRKLRRLTEDLQYSLALGKRVEALSTLQSFSTIQVGPLKGHSLRDKEVLKAAFATPLDPLITFGGAAGEFFNKALVPEGLVVCQAPEKTGKTFFLNEFAFRALRSLNPVAMFQAGDLSESELIIRLGMRIASRPLYADQLGKIPLPHKILRSEEDEEHGYGVEMRRLKRGSIIDAKSTKRAYDHFLRANGANPKNYDNYFRFSVHANGSLSVTEIKSILDTWLLQYGFMPKVIIIDYADILAPEPHREGGRRFAEDRNVINETWMALRRLAQERHALVLTATQANATAYSQEPALQTMRSYSEDKRKLAHVTGMFALNQTPDEKEVQTMRLNWLVQRGAPFHSKRALVVGTCFPLARAITCSAWKPRED